MGGARRRPTGAYTALCAQVRADQLVFNWKRQFVAMASARFGYHEITRLFEREVAMQDLKKIP